MSPACEIVLSTTFQNDLWNMFYWRSSEFSRGERSKKETYLKNILTRYLTLDDYIEQISQDSVDTMGIVKEIITQHWKNVYVKRRMK